MPLPPSKQQHTQPLHVPCCPLAAHSFTASSWRPGSRPRRSTTWQCARDGAIEQGSQAAAQAAARAATRAVAGGAALWHSALLRSGAATLGNDSGASRRVQRWRRAASGAASSNERVQRPAGRTSSFACATASSTRPASSTRGRPAWLPILFASPSTSSAATSWWTAMYC